MQLFDIELEIIVSSKMMGKLFSCFHRQKDRHEAYKRRRRRSSLGLMLRGDRNRCLQDMLPMATQLPDGRQAYIDYMTHDQMTETYNLIQTCAQEGQGFAVDEYPTEEEFREDIKGGDSFAIICDTTGEMIAGFILAISKFYRGSAGAVDPFLVVRSSERKRGIGEFIMNRVIEFSKYLNYQGIYVDTFSNNAALIRILDKVGGFTKVGYLPLGGLMKNGYAVSSIVYYKEISNSKVS
ncbi:uncharacterized protein LOC134691220 isoform X2 [Mytilus trossulus]|uniref:uncharacterized protein LOC134691220 isoform X2 n=1 Tax=Mytilus trossulus TaxID=6551 RepID=UPI0030076FAB